MVGSGFLSNHMSSPLSRMLHDILDDDHIQRHPQLIRHYTNVWPYYWSGPYNRIWLFTLLREVSIEHMQRVRHANRGRLLLRTPGPVPLWDLQVFLCWDQWLLNLSCFRTFEFRKSLGTSVLPLYIDQIHVHVFMTQSDIAIPIQTENTNAKSVWINNLIAECLCYYIESSWSMLLTSFKLEVNTKMCNSNFG